MLLIFPKKSKDFFAVNTHRVLSKSAKYFDNRFENKSNDYKIGRNFKFVTQGVRQLLGPPRKVKNSTMSF